MIDGETVHIHDLLSPDSLAEFSEAVRSVGIRTILVTPLLAKGLRSEQFISADRRFFPLPKGKLLF